MDDVAAGTALWFGPPERPLLGWLHRPADATARGAVVLCPPFGVELHFSHRIHRMLAGRLAAAGFVVARFDYDGTGQSAGEIDDPDRAGAWVASVAHAVALVRDEGAEWVAAVGLRLGATILATALAEGTALDAALLWDPCLSGKSFLREQVALLGTLDRSDADASGTEISGYRLSAATSAELRSFELPRDLPATPDGTLVLLDGERPSGNRLRRQLAAAVLEWDEYRLPDSIFDTGELYYTEPMPVLDRIVQWLDSRCRRPRHPLSEPSPRESRAVVAHTPDGRAVEERLMRFGDGHLFGIATEAVSCADRAPARGPVILLLSMGAEPSVGPGRQWVCLARRWAADGRRSIRFDLSGIGESPARPGEPERLIYAPAVLQDVREAIAAAAAQTAAGVVLVGVCSGAYAALATAPLVRPAGVVAFNPVLTFPAFERWWTEPAESPAFRPSLRARALGAVVGALGAAVRRVLGAARDWGRDAPWRDGLADRLPPAVWSLVYALRLAHSPAAFVTPVLDAEIPLLLVCGDQEAHQPLVRTPRPFARLAGAARGGFARIPDLDHSLRAETSRVAAAAAITEFLAELDGAPGEPRQAAATPIGPDVRETVAV